MNEITQSILSGMSVAGYAARVLCFCATCINPFCVSPNVVLASGASPSSLDWGVALRNDERVAPPDMGGDEVPLDWWNVLILANADSPAGREVVKMYRQFHPEIVDAQVLYLSGLTDSASATAVPADEIITRSDFEALIAAPTRAYLESLGAVDDVFVLLTTAGMPYRIEDTDPKFANVITPAGSNASLVVSKRAVIDAASVESELSVLFQIDPVLDSTARLPRQGRLVNPYQGYNSGIKAWSSARDILSERESFRWTTAWRVSKSPLWEGEFDFGGYTSANRIMSPASIYLVARLDGPRRSDRSVVFSVWEMLKRSAAVSNPQSPYFVGYSATRGAVAVDAAPNAQGLDWSAGYNLPVTLNWLNADEYFISPDAATFVSPWFYSNHFDNTFQWLSNLSAIDPVLSVAPVTVGLGGDVVKEETNAIMNQAHLATSEVLIALQTFGRNAQDGRPASYLMTSGPGGGPLFTCSPGAFFSSLESFNAVTMFTDVATSQAKIANFIEMGGTCAMGHAFEPEAAAVIQGDYVVRNMLRDDDGDGVGDLTIIESAYTGLPYLSWAEVFIGDPLTRLHRGLGGAVDLTVHPGDVNDDGLVGFDDAVLVMESYNTVIGDLFYAVGADQTRDGSVDGADLTLVLNNYGTIYP